MITYTELTCEFCKQTFKRESRIVKNTKSKIYFCSADCHRQGITTSSEVICKLCGKTFKKQKSQIQKSPNHFCSRKCSGTYVQARLPRKKLQGKCFNCKKPIPSRLKRCKECRIKHTQIIDGNTSIQMIHEAAKYQKSSAIRENARRVYKKSNRPKECFICHYKTHYEVCHIKAIKDFPKETLISVVNDISNLVAFCPNHHWEFDHGLIKMDLLAGVEPV